YDLKTKSLLKKINSPAGTVFADDRVNPNAISADGSRVLFISYHKRDTYLVDTVSGKTLSQWQPLAVRDNLGGGHMVLNTPGTLLFTGGVNDYRSYVQVWDAESGKLIRDLKIPAFNEAFQNFHLSPDDKCILMDYRDATRMYNVESGKLLWSKKIDSEHFIYSQNGKEFFAVVGQRLVRFETKTGNQLSPEASISEIPRDMYYLPQKNKIMFRYYGSLCLADTKEYKETENLIPDSLDHFYTDPTMPAGLNNTIYTYKRSVYAGNLDKGPAKKVLDFDGRTVAISPEHIVITFWDGGSSLKGPMRLYDASGKFIKDLDESKNATSIADIRFFANEKYIAVIAEGFLSVWDLDKAVRTWHFKSKLVSYGALLAVDQESKYVFIKNENEQIICFEALKGKMVWTYNLTEQEADKDDTIISYYVQSKTQTILLVTAHTIKLLDINSGALLATEKVSEGRMAKCALAPDGILYVMCNDTAVMHVDVSAWMPSAQTASAPGKSASGKFTLPDTKANATKALEQLESNDWNAFKWEEHGEKLIALLSGFEKDKGLAQIHQLCTEKLLAAGSAGTAPLKLLHRFGHVSNMVSFGLSPDGRYLATGSWVTDDYDAGGELMIWEVATGRCINILPHVSGGVGWPDYGGCVKWSADSRWLGVVINTNGVARFDPFSESNAPLEEFYETDGWDRPAQWCWHPKGDAFYIACWQGYDLPGCITPINKKAFNHTGAFGFQGELDKSIFKGDRKDEESPLQPGKFAGWSADGTYIFGNGYDMAWVKDVEKEELVYIIEDVNDDVVSWSPDGKYLLLLKGKKIEVLNGATGKKIKAIDFEADILQKIKAPVKKVERIVWSGNTMFAAMATGHVGLVSIYKNMELFGVIQTSLAANGDITETDNLVWAFSPDGKYGASLGKDKVVSVWSMEKGLPLVQTIKVQKEAKCVMMGASGSVITIDENHLNFYNGLSGEKLSDYNVKDHEEQETPSLKLSPLTVGETDLSTRFAVNPFFPADYKDDVTWIGAFPNGLVVCPKSKQKSLDIELTYVLANRFAWPYRWGKENVVADLESAALNPQSPFTAKEATLFKPDPAKKAKANEDAILILTPAQLFGKNAKVGKYELSDNKDFKPKASQGGIQAKEYAIATKEKGSYKSLQVLKGDALTKANLLKLVGKVVFYSENLMKRKELATLICVNDTYCYFMDMRFENFKQRGTGGANTEISEILWIAEAEAR
ncbi:MAG: hypothetical protein JWO06_3146, partial [Bacteroidota bacterium]|nr:hypothetical protein [Bacteroidota bacterium]